MQEPNVQQRRKEQNRRAQANLRRKRQQQIEGFEQQINQLNQEIRWLRSFADTLQVKQPLPICGTNHLSAPSADLTWPTPCKVPSAGPGANPLTKCAVSDPVNTFSFDDIDILGDVADPLAEQDTVDESYISCFPSSASTSSQQMDLAVAGMGLSGIPCGTAGIQDFVISPTGSQGSSTVPSCPFDCLAQNAATLGISSEGFLSTRSASPFYQPFSTHNFVLAAFQRLPFTLRPTVAQLSYPHLAWIDCIPEPDLRSRIIFGTCHKPPLLDCLDLWHDMLAAGDPDPGDHSDIPNWKPSAMFLDRWQMLLKMDLRDLQKMCIASNPPLRLINL